MADDEPDRAALLAEAYKRNLLPPDQKAAYEEALKRGLVKPDQTTRLERFGMGLMDPIYGGAQIGARMGLQSQSPFPLPPEADAGLTETVDKATREREQAYQARRGTDPGFDWMRAAGDVAPMLVPGAGIVSDVARATTAAPRVGASLPGLIRRGIGYGTAGVIGGVGGALQQPVEGESFGTEKAEQAVVGGALGGVTAGVGAALGAGARSIGNYLAREFPENVMTQAVQGILRRIEQDKAGGGPTATQALELVNAASPKPVTLFDVTGKNVERLAGNVYRAGGAAASRIDQFLQQRRAGTGTRLSADIAKYIKGDSSTFRATEGLLEARSTEARPLWDRVRAMQGVWSPRLQQFLEDPTIRSGLGRGYEIERLESLAEKRPFNPTQMGVDLDTQGNVKIISAPNMRALHMAKMGLDAMIADERDQITGRLSQRGVALEKVRQAYLEEIDGLDRSGIYRQAREAWQGRSKSLDAVRAGRGVFDNSPEENAAEFAKLSGSDQEFYRIGVADKLREQMAKAGLNGNEAMVLLKNQWTREQVRPIFRSENDFSEFVNAVNVERQMFIKESRTRFGSQTAERIAEDTGEDAERMAFKARMAENIFKGNWVSAVKDAYFRWRDLGLKPNPKVTEEIAKILFSTDIQPGSEVFRRLSGGQAPRTLRNPLVTASQALESGGAGVAPALGALSSPDAPTAALQ